MRKILVQKLVLLSLVLIALGVTYYFYQKGEISLLPQKRVDTLNENFNVQIPITENEYRLSYKDKSASTFDIADFEDNETWFGDGEFDSTTFYEGRSSLFVTSFNGKKSEVSLNKNFNIKNVSDFKFLFYLATEPNNIEEFNLIFAGEKWGYRFPVRDLAGGWNMLILPREKFSVFSLDHSGKTFSEVSIGAEKQEEIKKVIIELISRPKTRSTFNLDSLWAETEREYQNNWNADGERFLSIKKIKNQTKLLVAGLFGSLAVLSKGSAEDYIFQAEFIPLREGTFGFFLRGDYKSGYGYYLILGGVETDTWRIEKNGPFEGKIQTLGLGEGRISNFKIEKGQPYWLKAEMKGSQLTFYFSVDGKNFTELAEVNDTSFSSGGIGIAAFNHSMFFVDDLQFFR